MKISFCAPSRALLCSCNTVRNTAQEQSVLGTMYVIERSRHNRIYFTRQHETTTHGNRSCPSGHWASASMWIDGHGLVVDYSRMDVNAAMPYMQVWGAWLSAATLYALYTPCTQKRRSHCTPALSMMSLTVHRPAMMLAVYLTLLALTSY